jgi:ribonuclease P protein component
LTNQGPYDSKYLSALLATKGRSNEKNVSAEQCQTEENPRISDPDGNPGREKGSQAEEGEGPEEADRRGSTEARPFLNGGSLSQGREGFSKAARLTRRSQFLHLSREGKKQHTPHFVVISRINKSGESRLGITVSAKVGQAVVRNRIKRRLREFFRRIRSGLSPDRDVVIVAKPGAGRLSLGELSDELGRVPTFSAAGKKQG